MSPAAAFYTVSSAAYFLGAVALINSLRLQGHDEPVFVLDCGLAERDRELLAREATVVDHSPDSAPHLLKPVAPLRHPTETMVLMDADLIATRHLGELIAAARDGVLAFANHEDRWVAEWGELLELGKLEPRRYLSSAFVVFGGELGAGALELFGDRVGWVDVERTLLRANLFEPTVAGPRYPLELLDQDVLNAVLAARVPADRVHAPGPRGVAMTPFEGLRVLDLERPRCTYGDGFEPYLIHHILPGKPWLEPGLETPYTRLLRRLLSGPDLAIRVPSTELSLRLREGALARLERARGRAALRGRLALGRLRARAGAIARGRGARHASR